MFDFILELIIKVVYFFFPMIEYVFIVLTIDFVYIQSFIIKKI